VLLNKGTVAKPSHSPLGLHNDSSVLQCHLSINQVSLQSLLYFSKILLGQTSIMKN